MQRPEGYGRYWSKTKYKNRDFIEWYKWMYQSRLKINEEFINWVRSHDVKSIADFGCGIGIGFESAFKDREYIGVDISQRNIDWCNQTYTNPKHKYLYMDFIQEDLPQKAEVSVCNGTLENVWNINSALESMVRNSSKWIYASCFMGYHPNLESHQYNWVPDKKVYSSLVSPIESTRVLENLGCTEIQIFPSKKGDAPEAGEEAIIIAKVN